jgi:putative ABC transport system ATP-binding protein
MINTTVLEAKNLSRYYNRGSEVVKALHRLNLQLKQGQAISIIGRSGSGKTTFLNQVGCLDTPTSGSLIINGTDVTNLKEKDLVEFRRENIGFIFQLFYLIPTINVYENVELPLLFAKKRNRHKVMEVLEIVGLTAKQHLLPKQLNGGDMQRVAIARALINNPKILLADEPTGRLEKNEKEPIMNLFTKLKNEGLAIIIATHDLEQAKYCDLIYELKDGQIIAEHSKVEGIKLKG